MKLSAYIICKDEEAVIERCIKSISSAVDEIVVVDTGSTDNTLSIAGSLGAATYTLEWRDDFSYARNYALEKCSGDWVISLDADEYLAEGDDIKVKKYIEELSNNRHYDGLACKLVNIVPETKKEISRMTKMIAFRNTAGIAYCRPIHEKLLKKGKPLSLFFAEDITVMHTGYVLDETRYTKKMQRNISLIEKSISEGTADATDYFHLTQLYMGIGMNPEKIYDAAKKMYDLDEKDNSLPNTVAHRKYTLLAKAMRALNYSYNEISDVIDKAEKLYPDHPEVLVCRAYELMNSNRFDHAIKAYEQALCAHASYKGMMSNNFEQQAGEVNIKLAELNLVCGQALPAFDRYYELLKKDKYNKPATLGLLHLIRNHDPADSVMLLDTVYNRKNCEDVGYFLNCLSVVCIPRLLIYYENIWRNQFGKRDASMIASLLCTGNYKTAASISLEYLSRQPDSQIASMACAAIILGKAYADFEMTLKSIDEKSAALLENFRGMLAGNKKSCPDGLAKVLSAVVQPLGDGEACAYIEKAAAMDEQCFKAVETELKHIRRYALLEKLYETRAVKNALYKGEDLYFAGFYAMLQNEYKRAGEHFNSAMKSGFYSEGMQELKRISKSAEQINDVKEQQ